MSQLLGANESIVWNKFVCTEVYKFLKIFSTMRNKGISPAFVKTRITVTMMSLSFSYVQQVLQQIS